MKEAQVTFRLLYGETEVMAMHKEPFIQANGMPRTKGIRNPHIDAARAHKGGAMRDRRDRRPKDSRRAKEWRDE